jgi:hypothetical protein
LTSIRAAPVSPFRGLPRRAMRAGRERCGVMQADSRGRRGRARGAGRQV